MAVVRARTAVPGAISQAEALWYDLSRWSSFVDGFGHVASVDETWPVAGAVVWDSRPGGRGRVLEEVRWYSQREGQDVAVDDPKLTGTQRVRFAPGVVSLELDYRLKEGLWVVDVLFVRRQLRDSLARTLRRFAIELGGELELEDGAR